MGLNHEKHVDLDFSGLEKSIREANRERKLMIEALSRIFHHAYDDDTPIGQICADFDSMREIARLALLEATGREA